MTLCIGIDPGVNTGYACWTVETQHFMEVFTFNAIQAMERVRELGETDRVILFVEDCRNLYVSKQFRNDQRIKGVGSVQRDVKLWIEFAEHFGIEINLLKPGRYRKVGPSEFATWTKWTGRTSEHARAAAMMVWGIKASDLQRRA